jgi:hypothetical protein
MSGQQYQQAQQIGFPVDDPYAMQQGVMMLAADPKLYNLISNLHGPVYGPAQRQDILDWARKTGIPVSPRGTGGTSHFLQRVPEPKK